MRTSFFFNDLPNKLLNAYKWLKYVRSYDPSTRRTRLPGPPSVQIQTIDRCNATCIMCPYSPVEHSVRGNVMDDGLYRHVIEEIDRVGGTATICLMLQNEPLLDLKLPERVRFAKELFGGRVKVMTVTNGAPLTPALIEKLNEVRIDSVSVSIDAFHENTYKRIRHGIDLRRVRENTLALIDRLGSSRVSITFLRQRQNEGEEDEFVNFWREKGVRAHFIEPTNRAGTLDSYMRVRKPQPALWKKLIYPLLNRLIPACPIPFNRMTILWDGRVLLCGEDWGPRDTVGDISRQSLEEVWNGEKINHYRYLLRTHQARKSLVCSDCSLSENYWRI